MATQRTAITAAKVASSVQRASSLPSSWIQNRPTRAIADALLNKDNLMAPHDSLYEEVNQTGLLRSHRHFKHCLRLLKHQKRVHVICLGPEKVGSNRLKFSVKLTSRGRKTYLYFRESHKRGEENKAEPEPEGRGLKDALPESR